MSTVLIEVPEVRKKEKAPSPSGGEKAGGGGKMLFGLPGINPRGRGRLLSRMRREERLLNRGIFRVPNSKVLEAQRPKTWDPATGLFLFKR